MRRCLRYGLKARWGLLLFALLLFIVNIEMWDRGDRRTRPGPSVRTNPHISGSPTGNDPDPDSRAAEDEALNDRIASAVKTQIALAVPTQLAVGQAQTEHYETLPFAPNFFHPKPSTPINRTRPNCPHNIKTSTCCDVVHLIGSYKCGSTTLAVQLKHRMHDTSTHDESSGFADAGKEPCWALKDYESLKQKMTSDPSCNCDSPADTQRKKLLDACPFYTEQHASKIFCYNNNAKLVMLLRDPYDRIVSQFNNDVQLKHIRVPIHTYVTAKQNLKFSNYHAILDKFLQYFPPENILLVRTEALTDDAQRTVDAVRGHWNMPGREIHPLRANNMHEHTEKKNLTYHVPTGETHQNLLLTLTDYNKRLFELIGYQLPWKMLK